MLPHCILWAVSIPHREATNLQRSSSPYPVWVVSIPHREATNPYQHYNTTLRQHRFQSLIGKLQTVKSSQWQSWRVQVSIPHREATNDVVEKEISIRSEFQSLIGKLQTMAVENYLHLSGEVSIPHREATNKDRNLEWRRNQKDVSIPHREATNFFLLCQSLLSMPSFNPS